MIAWKGWHSEKLSGLGITVAFTPFSWRLSWTSEATIKNYQQASICLGPLFIEVGW